MFQRMKKTFLLISAAAAIVISGAAMHPVSTQAATKIKIDAKNFPDKKLREFLKNDQADPHNASKRVDQNQDGYLSDGEIKAVTKLVLSRKGENHSDKNMNHYGYVVLGNLKGLQYFTNCTELSVGFKGKNVEKKYLPKKLKTLKVGLQLNGGTVTNDVSQLTSLQFFSMNASPYYNDDLKKLEKINVTVDLSKNTNLKELTLYNCTAKNIEKCTKVEKLALWGCRNKSLNLKKLSKLQEVSVKENTGKEGNTCKGLLTTLDISGSKYVKKLTLNEKSLGSVTCARSVKKQMAVDKTGKVKLIFK